MSEGEFQQELRRVPLNRPAPRINYDQDDYDDADDAGSDGDPVEAIVPYKNARALLAYYCGIFSLVPVLGLILGPVAILLGILGFHYASKTRGAKGHVHAIAGIVCGSIGTMITLAIVVVLAFAIMG